MAAGRIVLQQYMPARDRNGRLVSGALLAVYANGTTTKASIYSDEALTTPLANPVEANSSGQFPAIWADDAVTYTLSIAAADGSSIGNPSVFDDYSVSTDYDAATAAIAEAAAAAAGEYYADILALSGAYPDPTALATRAAKAANLSDLADGDVALANLDFVQAGTGAATRTAKAKLRDVVSVADFGAVGDGTTNDTAAINAALAYVSGLGGGTVVFPAGTYKYAQGDGNAPADNITSDNVSIVGYGATIVSYNAALEQPNNAGNQNYRVFQATGQRGLSFRGLSFEGYCTSIALYDCEDFVIDGCRDDGQLTTAESNVLTITGITQASAGVVTYTGTDPVDQQFYTLTGVGGMTALNNIVVKPGSINTAANTFVLRTIDGVNIDTTGYGAYTSGGSATLATGYVRDKGVYLDNCKRGVISRCHFKNLAFAVYFIGDQATLRCEQMVVANCTFEITTTTGYTAFFPCGVYFLDIEDGIVDGCMFKNIYSSVINGSTGNGMGFGIYEGDGQSRNIAITGNTFIFEDSDGRTASGLYLSETRASTVTGNSFDVQAGSNVSALMRLDAKTHDTIYNVTGNTATVDATSDCYGIYMVGSATTTEPVVNIAANVITGGDYAVRVEGLGRGSYTIKGNTFRDQGADGVYFIGAQAHPHRGVVISDNEITGSFNRAIYMNDYCIQTVIENNRLLDGNRAALTGDSGSAVLFSSVSPGSIIRGNKAGNSTYMVGFAFGFTHATATTGRIYKDLTGGNTFVGLDNSTQWRRFAQASPVYGLFDYASTDVVENSALGAGGIPQWHGIYGLRPEITSSVSSTAVIPITPGFASSFIAGQGVLITKSATPENGDFADTTKWHMSTVASFDAGANTITLVDPIPAGDGTYVAGTAKLVFGYFRGSAAIAS